MGNCTKACKKREGAKRRVHPSSKRPIHREEVGPIEQINKERRVGWREDLVTDDESHGGTKETRKYNRDETASQRNEKKNFHKSREKNNVEYLSKKNSISPHYHLTIPKGNSLLEPIDLGAKNSKDAQSFPKKRKKKHKEKKKDQRNNEQ